MKSLSSIYLRYTNGLITIQAAATEFGFKEAGMMIRIAKHENKLLQTLQTLDEIVENRISREQAALRLSITTRQVNSLMKSWGVARPISLRKVQESSSELKWDVRTTFAILYIGGTLNLSRSAYYAGIGERQMRRWISDLLLTYCQLTYKELSKLEMTKRSEVSVCVKVAKHISEADLSEAIKIGNSKENIRNAAVSKVVAKSKIRKFQNILVSGNA